MILTLHRNIKSNLQNAPKSNVNKLLESLECVHCHRLSIFLKVTKPILLLSSFGEFTNVQYNDKGLSSVSPVYILSMSYTYNVLMIKGQQIDF